MLDLSLAGASFHTLREVAFFLIQPNSLPPDAALALYVSTNGMDWSFRGFISNQHPSEVLPLAWPDPSEVSKPQIGFSFEPLKEASAKECSKMGARQDFARRVGLDLFNFMQSFGGVQTMGKDTLLVPTNILDAWFNRLNSKLQKDPNFLTRAKDVV